MKPTTNHEKLTQKEFNTKLKHDYEPQVDDIIYSFRLDLYFKVYTIGLNCTLQELNPDLSTTPNHYYVSRKDVQYYILITRVTK